MSESGPYTPESFAPASGPKLKRRRVRQGTQSCWECRRRKIRCTFAAPTDRLCNGCKRRGTSCISQEYHDVPTSSSTTIEQNRRVEERLARVEAIVEQLLEREPGNGVNAGLLRQAIRDFSDTASSLGPIRTDRSIQRRSLSTPKRQGAKVTEPPKGEYLSQVLLAAWPNQQDLDIILRMPVALVTLPHFGLCAPASKSAGEDVRELFQLPPPGSHPVMITRKLLILGSFIQAIPVSSLDSLEGLSASHEDIMSRLVTAASLVTSDDELSNSIEGIECLVIEGSYQNYAGHLRCAWRLIRRAMGLAQMMGLHRSGSDSEVVMLTTRDPHKRVNVDPEHMWFRLVQGERCLSLMLGLPPGISEDNFARSDILESCSPLERLKRISCVAAGRILQRNHANLYDVAQTHEIDKILQEAAAYMPPQWWLSPDRSACRDEGEWLDRLMNQLMFYHILGQLHFPFMLCAVDHSKYDYSKMTAVHASREVLSRFVSFRSASFTASYCRCLEIMAFSAMTTLCIAHMTSFHQPQTHSPFGFLAHQRLSDRGLMERALVIMGPAEGDTNDMLACKIGITLQRLLAMAADAAQGAVYSMDSSVGSTGSSVEDAFCGGKVDNGGDVLYLRLPSFGTVKVERSFDPLYLLSSSELNGKSDVPEVSTVQNPDWQTSLSVENTADDVTLHNIDSLIFENTLHGAGRFDDELLESWTLTE